MTTTYERLLEVTVPPETGTLGAFILGTNVLSSHSGRSIAAAVSTWRWYVRIIKPGSGAVLGHFILGTDVLTPPAWSDITDDCHGVHFERGGSPAINPGAGQLMVTIDNESDVYSPWQSIYNGPGTVIQCGWYVGADSDALPLWTGIVTEWNERTDGVNARIWVDVTALETISLLGNNKETAITATGAGEAIAARLARVLTAARWQFGSFVKVPGAWNSWAFQNTTLSDDSWSELQAVAQTLAVVFKSGLNGRAIVAERDDGPITGYEIAGLDFDIVADSIITANDDLILVGSVPVGRVGGTPVTYTSDISVARYQRRSLPFSGMLTEDPGANADLERYANDKLDRGTQTYRVKQFQIDTGHGDDVYQFIARMDLGTRISIDKPNHDGTGILFSDYLVCGYTADVIPLPGDRKVAMRVTIQTEPSTSASWRKRQIITATALGTTTTSGTATAERIVEATALGTTTTAGTATASVCHPEPRFAYTGSVQTWTVPAGVTRAHITMRGAAGSGGGGLTGGVGAGGAGAEVTGDLVVSAGQVWDIYVGGRPPTGTCGRIGAGWPNGGSGANNGSSGCNFVGGGGGGSTSMRLHGDAFNLSVAVAAGGGGGSGGDSHAPANSGGNGGWNPGADGTGFAGSGHGAKGATQSAGGQGGCDGDSSTKTGGDGSAGQGGDGALSVHSDSGICGGGGGGGWYGGGGAGAGFAGVSSNHPGGAGGGSSIADGLSNVTHQDGVQSAADGYLDISGCSS